MNFASHIHAQTIVRRSIARLGRVARETAVVGGCVLLLAGSSAAATITFDDFTAPTLLSDAEPLTARYAADGVTFSGTGAILDQDSAFGITGFSPRNFVAYEEGGFIGPPGPMQGIGSAADVLSFSTPVSSLSLRAGSAGTGLRLNIEAFDAADMLVNSANVALTSSLQLVGFSGLSGVTRVTLGLANADFGDTLVIDDLTFDTGNVQPVPEPASLLLIGTGLVAGLRRFRRRA